jgi:hypothetical protein
MADTAGYYHAAYVVAGDPSAHSTMSLVSRRRRVRARLAALERGDLH